MSDDDCEAFYNNEWADKDRVEAIRAVLRRGNPSKRFLRHLEMMVRFEGEKRANARHWEKLQFKLTLGRMGRGQPKKSNKLGKAALAAVAGKRPGQQKKAEINLAIRSGVSQKTVQNALRAARRELDQGPHLIFGSRAEVEEADRRDCVPWPAGLEDEIERNEIPE